MLEIRSGRTAARNGYDGRGPDMAGTTGWRQAIAPGWLCGECCMALNSGKFSSVLSLV